jgi:hypothetical protein
MYRYQRTSMLIFSLACFAAFGCDEPETVEDPSTPVVQALLSDSVAIGELFELQGRNFLDGENGRSALLFEGSFEGVDGVSEPVFVEAPVFLGESDDDGSQVVQWSRFGPFSHPFAVIGRPGRFSGSVTAINRFDDGREVEGEPLDASIEVEPSIEFVELQPVGAECGMPALSGFAGIPYRIGVRAMGFVPKEFDFQITSLQHLDAIESVESFRQAAGGPDIAIGDNEDIVFQPVPADLKFYVAAILVRATDDSGRSIESVLPFSIHRPVEVHYDGKYEIAEHYIPEPVTACIPGAIGNRVTYSETRSETRQRSVQVRISQSWAEDHVSGTTADWRDGYSVGETSSTTAGVSSSDTATEGSSLTEGEAYNNSESNNFTYGTADAENWNSSHNVGVEGSVEVGASGGASIPLVAEGKVSTSVRVTGRYGYTWGSGGSATTSRNWGSTTNRGSSQTWSGQYSLANSTTQGRSMSDTEGRTSSRTYNFGGSASESQRISEGMSEDEASTWSESSSHSTLTSYTGFIPVGKFGVFYRQTLRMARVGKVVAYNACGEQSAMGEIVLNEWKWAPDLAIGDSCDTTIPESNLPEAKCHIPPCQ